MKKIISFDCWDTLIKRKCHPEEIKLHTAKYIFLKYFDELKEDYKDIYKILKYRNQIEEEIGKANKEKGFNFEYRIEDVFKKLQKEIFYKKLSDLSEELVKFEIKIEKENIFINPDILPIIEKYKDLKMYVISDFYMSGKALEELFNYVKLPVEFEKIYSSADYLLNKREGDLYPFVEKELGIKPEEHIHVGDNKHSDVEMANKYGIEAIELPRVNNSEIIERNRKIQIDLSNAKKDDKNEIFNIGVDLAPLVYFFVYNVIENAIRNKVKKVYYQTREGETFIKIHKIIQENNPFNTEIPECEILEVSRMGTFSASLKEVSVPELLRLWSQYRVQSMEDLFKTLAIDIKKYEKYIEKYNLNKEQKINELWFNVQVQNLFADEDFKKDIQKEIDTKRKELVRFFKEKRNIKNDNEPLFVVDIGWRGTIQDNLAYIFPEKEIIGMYLTLYDFYNLQPKNTKKFSFLDNEYMKYEYIAIILTLLEWIYNPGTGSVVEYKDGEVIRVAKDKELNVVKNYILPMQEGMLEGAKVINQYMKTHPYESVETKEYVYDLIKRIKEEPSKKLVEIYYGMVFNDTFGNLGYIEKESKLKFIDRINIFKCRNLIRNEVWKEAFIIYNNLQYIKILMKIKKIFRRKKRK